MRWIVKEKLTMKLTAEYFEIFRRYHDEDVSFMGFSPLWSRPDWMICQVFAVPPPAVRPSVKHDSQQRSEDDISHIIVILLKLIKLYEKKYNKMRLKMLSMIGQLYYNIILQPC